MSEGNEISRRYKGPGDGTPYVPSWLADDPVCNCGGEPHGKHCALVLNGMENAALHCVCVFLRLVKSGKLLANIPSAADPDCLKIAQELTDAVRLAESIVAKNVARGTTPA